MAELPAQNPIDPNHDPVTNLVSWKFQIAEPDPHLRPYNRNVTLFVRNSPDQGFRWRLWDVGRTSLTRENGLELTRFGRHGFVGFRPPRERTRSQTD
jgi:hypothetical protein